MATAPILPPAPKMSCPITGGETHANPFLQTLVDPALGVYKLRTKDVERSGNMLVAGNKYKTTMGQWLNRVYAIIAEAKASEGRRSGSR